MNSKKLSGKKTILPKINTLMTENISFFRKSDIWTEIIGWEFQFFNLIKPEIISIKSNKYLKFLKEW